ncbi:MAG: agmatine deiminase family protein [Ammonifex sp.]|jgi:agmatine deiminase|nr:MAG: agmatine deiminase family protein [Ammonifex sp.]
MKKRCSIIILASACVLITLAASACRGPYRKLEYYGGRGPTSYVFPGEFEKQQAIWMQWPSGVYNAGSQPVNHVMISIIKALAPYIRVNLISQSTEEIKQIKDLLKTNGFTGTNVHYYVINHLSIWARDVGPIFVKDRQNRLNVVNFGFNNYGRGGDQHYINVEGQVDKLTAQLLGLPVINTKLICEGGAIESNGRGTMMVTESVALTRNPGLTKKQIENEYKRVLGVRKVIWLKKGLAEDEPITSGHINEMARFADPNTILLAQVLPGDRYANRTSQNSYLRLEENYRILLNSTDQDGKPFRIIRIPMPPTLYEEANNTGEIPVRSYLNYAVTNGAVLMQTYWKPGRSNTLKTTEDQVKSIFRRVFPGRNIIGINAENVNLWGGGIHCITQHMPAN